MVLFFCKLCMNINFSVLSGLLRDQYLEFIIYSVLLQSTLPNFKQNEFSVVRQHEEFIWLHDSFVENEEYAGFIVSRATT